MKQGGRVIIVAPSLLSADFSRLADEIRSVERSGADMLHIDVMDGHFVPNITVGPVVVRHIRKVTKLPLDVHLMIEEPERFIQPFADAGSNLLTVHAEALTRAGFLRIRRSLRRRGIRCGISLNPGTSLARIEPLLGLVDFVLVMSVVPGFGGQAFIPSVLPKIRRLREQYSGDIAVDGGINDRTAALAIKAGANVLAAGSYIFGARDVASAIERIRHAGE